MDFNSMLSKLKEDAAKVADSSKIQPPPAKKQRLCQEEEDFSFPNTTLVRNIYLVCPPNVQTGGPEAMHQLCNAINDPDLTAHDDSIQAFMLYLQEIKPITFADPPMVDHAHDAQIVEAYRSIYPHLKVSESLPAIEKYYPNNEKKKPVQYNNNLIIWPECWTHLIDSMYVNQHDDDDNNNTAKQQPGKQKMNQTAIWWLSVDNNNSKFKDWNKRRDILHLYQSEYAKQYIMKNLNIKTLANKLDKATTTTDTSTGSPRHENIIGMTEYIPERQISTKPTTISNQVRDLDILYNPFKGIHYTDSIRKRSESKKIRFTPIGGGPNGRDRISAEEVGMLLKRAKCYIDFGPHPGMDRLPREAALANCIVITNKSGAAKFTEDVPIPSEYKFGRFDVDAIHKLLTKCLDNYDEQVKIFDEYRKWIHGQKEKMMNVCLKELLESIGSSRQGKD